jgi:hypothetical protein
MDSAPDVVTDYLRRQLIGPWGGVTEELTDPPDQRYLMGILFPQETTTDEAFEQDVVDEEAGDTDDDPIALANQHMPSCVGLSFVVSGAAEIEVRVEAARYVSTSSHWHRIPLTSDGGERHTLSAPSSGGRQPTPVLVGRAELSAQWRPFGASWLVTVALVNTQVKQSGGTGHEACLCQVEVTCAPVGGVIAPYPTADRVPLDPEDEELAFVYRDVPTFAVGHGCAADWNSTGSELPANVRTNFLPAVTVPQAVFDVPGFNALRGVEAHEVGVVGAQPSRRKQEH